MGANHFERSGGRHTEFARHRPGADVMMRVGVHIGAESDGDVGLQTELSGKFVHPLQFPFGLHIDPCHIRAQRRFNFGLGFADAREDNARRVCADLQNTKELTAGDDVEACAFFFEQTKDGEIGVGLDRIADGWLQRRKCRRDAAVVFADAIGRVNVQRRSELGSEGRERDRLAVERVVEVPKRSQGSQVVEWSCSRLTIGQSTVSHLPSATGPQCTVGLAAPWQCLNFLPEPHGQGSLRPTFVNRGSTAGRPSWGAGEKGRDGIEDGAGSCPT